MRKFLKTYWFPLLLLTAILLGAQLGNYISHLPDGIAILKTKIKPIGDIFLNGLFMMLVPLVFSSIASAVANMRNASRLGKVMGAMMVVFVITGVIASVIMAAVLMIFPLGDGINAVLTPSEPTEKLDPVQQIVRAITVTDFNELLSRKNMLPLIIFSVLMGLAVNQLGEKARVFADFLQATNEVMMKMVQYVMYLAPVGLLAYFAYLTGTFGSEFMDTLKKAVLIYFPVSTAYFFVFFSLYAWWAGGMNGFRTFWKHITPPALVALATGSSMAAIPANLEASEKAGVPKDISEMVIPIGATIHMDGSCLAAMLKIALLFSLYGQQFSGLETISTAIGVALMSGLVMSGIPGGGKIGELLTISLYGFPPESMIVISALGDVVDAPATAVNSVGDNVASMMVARIVEGDQWLTAKS